MNIQAVEKYLTKNRIDIQNANANLSVASVPYDAYVNSSIVHGVNFSPLFFFFMFNQKIHHFQIVSQNLVDVLAKKVYSNYLKDKLSLNKMIAKHLTSIRGIDMVWARYKKEKKITSNIILYHFENFLKASRIFWYYSSVGEDKGEIINSEIIPAFAKRHNFDSNKAREIFGDLCEPKELSFLNAERKDFLQLCLLFYKNSGDTKIKNEIQSYIKRHFWIKSDFYSATHLSVNSVINDIKKELLQKNINQVQRELNSIISKAKDINFARRKILARLQLLKKDKDDIYFSSRTIYWIDQRKLGQAKFFYYYASFIEDISKLYGLTYQELVSYDFYDVLNLLKRNKKLKKSDVLGRHKNYLAVFQKNKPIKYFYGKEINKIFKLASQSNAKEVKGFVAYQGNKKIVRGIARIIFNPTKERFKKNEILVTSMTRIEFVPLMRKALAIITNEGGIASHAAIVARELKIPCFVGTKIATKVLKDGDKVEIDTIQGVVRKL
ncbi:MAG: PEP-utilizing enzyme [Patescibacteria group bacterium]|jgi:phosphohistidine swiveling domain-containing protein